jgi:hypothetical protein
VLSKRRAGDRARSGKHAHSQRDSKQVVLQD